MRDMSKFPPSNGTRKAGIYVFAAHICIEVKLLSAETQSESSGMRTSHDTKLFGLTRAQHTSLHQLMDHVTSSNNSNKTKVAKKRITHVQLKCAETWDTTRARHLRLPNHTASMAYKNGKQSLVSLRQGFK